MSGYSTPQEAWFVPSEGSRSQISSSRLDDFRCPECGRWGDGEVRLLIPEVPFCLDGPNPWRGVSHAVYCEGCRFLIPEHLALLKDSEPQRRTARFEWRTVFRPWAVDDPRYFDPRPYQPRLL